MRSFESMAAPHQTGLQPRCGVPVQDTLMDGFIQMGERSGHCLADPAEIARSQHFTDLTQAGAKDSLVDTVSSRTATGLAYSFQC